MVTLYYYLAILNIHSDFSPRQQESGSAHGDAPDFSLSKKVSDDRSILHSISLYFLTFGAGRHVRLKTLTQRVANTAQGCVVVLIWTPQQAQAGDKRERAINMLNCNVFYPGHRMQFFNGCSQCKMEQRKIVISPDRCRKRSGHFVVSPQ